MKVDVNILSVTNGSITPNHDADPCEDTLSQTSLAIDHYSPMPTDMHRQILGHAGSKSINRIKAVSHFFRAQGNDPFVQAACAERFAYRYAPLAKWAALLHASVNAPHELIPSDALLATHHNNFCILNPAHITIVPGAPRWHTNARTAALMHRDRTIGFVELQPPKRADSMRLIGLNDHNGQLVGLGKVGSIYRHFHIETFLASPTGLVNTPHLLQELRKQNLKVGSEYFIVFKTRNGDKKAGALMEVPLGHEVCLRDFEKRIDRTDDDDNDSDD